MYRRILLIGITHLFLAACASVKTTLYDQDATRSVKAWTVEFIYESGRTEQAFSREKGAETRVIIDGQRRRDLKLRDDLAYLLKDVHKINASRTKRDGAGAIRILPMDFSSGGFRSLDVEIVLPNGEIGGRLQIKNGDRNATFKDDDDFTEYAAEAIAKAISGGK